ncbi:MAG: CRTAC1 family protein [Acidobacteria bacterium]|nr:CRTAC1 family protein [Acidobacteriota bacterium]
MRAGWFAATVLVGFLVAPGTPAQPYFTDVTSEAGLADKPGFRLSVGDVNGDGYPDIFLHRNQDDTSGDVLNKQYLYLNVAGDNPGDPFSRKFIDITWSSNIRANRQGTAAGRHSDGAIFADVDNDGDLDIFTMAYVHRNQTLDKGRNDLLLNDGAAHFTLAPNSPFHLDPIWNTAGAVFADYDNDGNVDLFLGNWYNVDTPIEQKLYRGHGDGSFSNVTAAAGMSGAASAIYGVAAADWDGDGDTDFFAPCYGWTVVLAKSIHWRNNGNGTFTRVEDQSKYTQYTGFPTGKASFGSMPRDYDDDGDIDLLEILTHGVGDGDGSVHSTVLTNTNDVFSWDFARVRNRASEDPDITHHGDHYASWFDYDNDGLADFALTESGYDNNRFYLFRQAGNRAFSPVTVAAGLNAINEANLPPHNVLPLDFDLDGDEDLLVGFADDVNGIQLWRNDVGTLKNWIVVTLEGAGIPGYANRSAIGAWVELSAGGKTWTREVYAGNGHMGPQVPLSLHFGLGNATSVERIRVRWPNPGLTWSEVTALPVNQFVRLREPCPVPDDPTGLLLGRAGPDIVLAWDDPAVPGLAWSVYRDARPDPATWGPAHAAGVTDQDPGTPGIQWRDAGAAGDGQTWFYLVAAANACGESPLGTP